LVDYGFEGGKRILRLTQNSALVAAEIARKQ